MINFPEMFTTAHDVLNPNQRQQFPEMFTRARDVLNHIQCQIFLKCSLERPPLWSSSQSSWLQIRMPGFDSRHYQKKSSGSGTGSTQPREYN
jgi:hypothetical protein